MGRDGGPNEPAAAMAKHQEPEELLKRHRGDHKEINRRDPLRMVAKEGFPGLQRPTLPRHHVFRHRRLGNLDAELEQLTMDLGRSPERVLKAHSSDKVANLLIDPRSATERTRLPSPVSCKPHSVPTH